MQEKFTVAVIGMGNVGATTAYALTLSSAADHVILYNRSKDRAEGELFDLDDALAFLPKLQFTATDNLDDLKAADAIIMTAGKAQEPGQTRLDLARDNIAILESVFRPLFQVNPDAVYILATNPVDVLTNRAIQLHKEVTGRDWAGNIFGTGTLLDTARLRVMLSQKLHVHPQAVHAYILGEHGDSSFPAFSPAMVGGLPLRAMIEQNGLNPDDVLRELTDAVRGDAQKIIQRKGATYYGIATAIAQLIRTVRTDQGAIYPVSVPLQGYYDLHDVCLSLPTVIGRRGVSQIMRVSLSEDEAHLLRASAERVRNVQ